MSQSTGCIWQISCPRGIRTNKYMVGVNRFLDGLAQYARSQGDTPIFSRGRKRRLVRMPLH